MQFIPMPCAPRVVNAMVVLAGCATRFELMASDGN